MPARHRLIAGGYRARHEQIPAGSRSIAVDLDVAVQAVMYREGEDARRSPEEVPDRVAPFEAAQRGAFPNRILGEQTGNPVGIAIGAQFVRAVSNQIDCLAPRQTIALV